MMTVKRFKWLVVALLVLLLLFLIGPPTALASGDDDDGATATATADAAANAGATATATGGNLVGGDMIGGDTSINTGSNRAYAFSHSLGDVDINEGQNCMGSEQWGTFVVSRQTNELNPWCAALFYELNGKHDFAAKMRCDIKEISNKYLTAEECWLDQELTPTLNAPELAELYDQAARYEEHQVIEDEHDEELEVVQMQQQAILESLASYEQRLAERPEPIVVTQEPRISEEQIEQAWQLIKGAKGEPEK